MLQPNDGASATPLGADGSPEAALRARWNAALGGRAADRLVSPGLTVDGA